MQQELQSLRAEVVEARRDCNALQRSAEAAQRDSMAAGEAAVHLEEEVSELRSQLHRTEQSTQVCETSLCRKHVPCSVCAHDWHPMAVSTVQVASADRQQEVVSMAAALEKARVTLACQTEEAAAASAKHASTVSAFETRLRAVEADLERAHEQRALAESTARELKIRTESEESGRQSRLQVQLGVAEAARLELQQEVDRLLAKQRASFSLADMQGASESVVTGLGFEAWRADGDAVVRSRKGADNGMLQLMETVESRRVKGRLSVRMWLLIGYAGLLHLFVMLQFTQHKATLCDGGAPQVGHAGKIRLESRSLPG